MEIRDFCRRIVETSEIEAKLEGPGGALTDDDPGPSLRLEEPGRPPDLRIQPAARARVPSLRGLQDPKQKPRIVHAMANHELQAVELFAWSLLAFPETPAEFRLDTLRVLREEQMHTRLYMRRLEALGVRLGEYPVSGYFWNKIRRVESPAQFLCTMCLTFENANLDHSIDYAAEARSLGDDETADHPRSGPSRRNRARSIRLDLARTIQGPRPIDDRGLPGERCVAPSTGARQRRFLPRRRPPSRGARRRVHSTHRGREPLTRLLIANLDAEAEFAKRALPASVLRRISSLGTLLRVFAQSDRDQVWTPAPVAGDCARRVPGWPSPRWVSGPAGTALIEPGETLAWCSTPSTRRWAESRAVGRRRVEASKSSAAPQKRAVRSQSGRLRVVSSVWSVGGGDAQATRQLAHRSTMVEVARHAGLEARSVVVTSLDEIAARTAEAGPSAWILKAPLSASGRERLIFSRDELTEARPRLERLIAKDDSLLLEPYDRRRADFGACGLVTDAEVVYAGSHAATVGESGQVEGICVELDIDETSDGNPPAAPGIRPDEEAALRRTTLVVGEYARCLGFRGPFGVDAWRYVAPNGDDAFRSLGEINPRLTLGWVLRAAAEHFEDRRRGARGGSIELRIGPRADPQRLALGDPPVSVSVS